MIAGKKAIKGPKGVKSGSIIDDELLESLSRGQWWQLVLEDEADAGKH
jgi:DNA-directed RNA polymerase subunit beta